MSLIQALPIIRRQCSAPVSSLYPCIVTLAHRLSMETTSSTNHPVPRAKMPTCAPLPLGLVSGCPHPYNKLLLPGEPSLLPTPCLGPDYKCPFLHTWVYVGTFFFVVSIRKRALRNAMQPLSSYSHWQEQISCSAICVWARRWRWQEITPPPTRRGIVQDKEDILWTVTLTRLPQKWPCFGPI